MQALRAMVISFIIVLAFTTLLLADTVGFDLDDCLSFSTPAFAVGFNASVEPFSDGFWEHVNGSDEGNSTVKQSMLPVLKKHIEAGDTVYVITARRAVNTQPVKAWVNKHLGISETNVYFASPKSDLIRELGITRFYGDSDTDITEALEGGALPIRVLRSSRSSYRKNYTPGKFDEEILIDSEE
jgi:acid phosphatase (class B)